MVGGSLRVLRLLPPLKLVAMILLKVANLKIFGSKKTTGPKQTRQKSAKVIYD
jgi:hypothetical protein